MDTHAYHIRGAPTTTGVVSMISGANAPSLIPLPGFVRSHALQVKGAGAAPTAWDVVLEGSLDGTSWTTICEHSSANAQGDGTYVTNNGVNHQAAWPMPALYVRVRVVSVTLGSATALNIVAQGER